MADEGQAVDEEPEEEAQEMQRAESDEQREQRAVALKAAGNKKYAAKAYGDALRLYSEAIGLFPRPEFHGNRAACFMAMGRFAEALSDCHSALRLDPCFKKAYLRGTKCYAELSDLEGAVRFAQTGLARFPNDGDLQQGLGRVEILRGKLQRIEAKLSSVSLKYDSLFESLLDPTAAANANATAPEEDEKDPAAAEGTRHRLASDDEKDIDVALSMISGLMSQAQSASLSLKCTQIRALLIRQNYDGALSAATNVLRGNKDNNEVTRLRAIALFRSGQSDSAIRHLQQILRRDPDSAAARTLFKHFKAVGRAKERGNRAFNAGQLDDAVAAYSECLRLDPTNLRFCCVVYANRAAVWLRRADWQRALDDATTAIGLDGSYSKAYCRRIQALYKLERFDEAVGDAETALALDPSSAELKQQLRESRLELKKSKRKDYYKVLGVEKTASEKEIKKGFRKQAMLWHPDKFATASADEKQAAEERFKEIGEAYEVLKDETLRSRYDSGVDIDRLKGGGGMPGGMDMAHIFDLLGGMHGGGGMPGGFQQFHSGGGGAQQFTFRFG